MTDTQLEAHAGSNTETPLRASDYPMTGLVLLSVPAWEPSHLRQSLLLNWQINAGEPPQTPREPWIFRVNGSLVVVGLEPRPVPDHAADEQAKNCHDWPEAADVAHAHQAYLAVAVIAESASLIENARTAMKVLASLCEQPNARAVNAASRLFAPDVYRKAALAMQDSEKAFPIFNLIYFGLWQQNDVEGLSGYTVGLDRFGVREVEIQGSLLKPLEIRALMVDAAMMQITRGKTFAEGEEVKLGGRTYRALIAASAALPIPETTHLVPMP